MTIHPVKLIRQITITAVLIVSLPLMAYGDSCPAWASCPIDGAQANKVNTEYEGMIAIGVYEHTTTTGQIHRFRQRCN